MTAKSTSEMEPVPVLFRTWKPSAGAGEGVIAVFPTIPADTMGYKCSMFEHVGQHGGGDPMVVIQRTRPATPQEYRALKRELESAPYDYKLRVCERMSRTMRDECMREARRMRGGGGARANGCRRRAALR